MTVVRIALVLINSIGFAVLAAVAARRARQAIGSGVRGLYWGMAAASGAVAIGGIQRLLLQLSHAGVLGDDVRAVVLENQALVQSMVVAGLGFVSWQVLARTADKVTTADRLLAAFGASVPGIDWSTLRITTRQQEVLRLISDGVLSDAALSEKLNISRETVRSHVKSLTRIAGVSSRLELAVATHRNPPSFFDH